MKSTAVLCICNIAKTWVRHCQGHESVTPPPPPLQKPVTRTTSENNKHTDSDHDEPWPSWSCSGCRGTSADRRWCHRCRWSVPQWAASCWRRSGCCHRRHPPAHSPARWRRCAWGSLKTLPATSCTGCPTQGRRPPPAPGATDRVSIHRVSHEHSKHWGDRQQDFVSLLWQCLNFFNICLIYIIVSLLYETRSCKTNILLRTIKQI